MIVDKYPMSKRSLEIFKEYWPASLSQAAFREAMRVCQAELIRSHWHRMRPETRERALRTLESLEGGNCPLR